MMTLAEKLQSGKRVMTAEIAPPKGPGIKRLLENANTVGPHVDAVNVTDCQRALVKMSSLAACRLLLDAGFEPVLQLTCRDRNSIALQSDLMGAWALGIRNVLCLTGDPVKVGDSPKSKSVFEVESVRQLEMVGHLQRGTDWNGNKLNRKTQFLLGAVVNPTGQSMGGQLRRMEKKVAAGANFFQTQANYDLDDFAGFLEQARPFGAKVLAGILVLHSFEAARFIHENIPGIRVPDSVLEDFRKTENAEDFGIDFAVKTMRHLEPVCDGFHIMTIKREELIPRVLERYYGTGKAKEDSRSRMPSAAGR